MDIRINGTVYYDEIQADKKGNKRNDWAWNTNGIVSFRLTPTTTLQCNGNYISDLQTVQGKIESRYRIDTGIRQRRSNSTNKRLVRIGKRNYRNRYADII